MTTGRCPPQSEVGWREGCPWHFKAYVGSIARTRMTNHLFVGDRESQTKKLQKYLKSYNWKYTTTLSCYCKKGMLQTKTCIIKSDKGAPLDTPCTCAIKRFSSSFSQEGGRKWNEKESSTPFSKKKTTCQHLQRGAKWFLKGVNSPSLRV